MSLKKNLILSLFFFVFSQITQAQSLEEQLLEAIENKNTESVKKLLDKGANPNHTDTHNASFLMWVAFKMDTATFELLVSKGAKIREQEGIIWLDDRGINYYGSLMAIAAGENKLDLLKLLVEKYKMPLNLREYNPQDNQYTGWTALQWASYRGHYEVVNYLISQKAYLESYDNDETPLHLSIIQKKQNIANLLIKSGANVNKKNQQGLSSLYLATFYDLPQTVEMLWKKQKKSMEKGLLETAIKDGNVEIAAFLIKNKYEILSPFSDSTYAIHQACKNGYEDLVKLLLKNKKVISQIDKYGNTPLMYAAYNGQLRICKLLIEKGADKSIINKQKKSALDLAESRKLNEVINYLKNNEYQEPDEWQKLNQEAVRYYNQNKIEKAEEVLKQALNFVDSKYSQQSEEYASALFNLAELHKMQKNYAQAQKDYEKSLEIRKKINSPQITKTQISLGDNFFVQGEYSKAVEIYAEVYQKVSPTQATTWDLLNLSAKLGNSYYLAGFYEKATFFLEQRLQLSEKLAGKESLEYAYALSDWANLLQDLGRLNEAKEVYKNSLAIMQNQGNNSAYEANSHLVLIGNYADVLVALGEYSLGEFLYKDYVLPQIEPRNKAIFLSNLGVLYLQTSRYKEAEQTLSEALQLKKRIFGEKHPSYLATLAYLADVHLEQEDYSKASPIYDKITNRKDTTSLLYLNALNDKAIIYQKQGQKAKAEEYYLKLLKQANPKSQFYPAYLNNIANFYQKNKDFKSAEKYFLQSKKLKEEVYGKKHLSYLLSISNLASFYQQTNDLQKAHEYFQEANQLSIELIHKFLPYMSEKARTDFLAHFYDYYYNFIHFAWQYAPKKPTILGDLFDFRLATKSLLLMDASKKIEINSQDTSMLNYYHNYLKAKDLLNKLYTLPQKELSQSPVSIEQQEKIVNDLEQNLNFMLFNRKSKKDTKLSWQDIQARLKPKEAAVEVIRFFRNSKDSSDTYYLFLIIKPNQNYIESVLLSNGTLLEKEALQYYINAIKYRKEDKNSYKLYWSAISEKLKGIEHIYFSPDNVYNQISLYSLQNPANRKYLIDELEISLLNNLKQLADSPIKNISGKAVFFAFPNYQLDMPKEKNDKLNEENTRENQNTREFSTLNISSLPGTKEEVEGIENLLQRNGMKTEKFLENDATESNLKAIKNPKILHIATHGYFLADLKHLNFYDRVLGIQKKVLEQNSLFRSGLMLAGAESYLKNQNQKQTQFAENGILTAYEATMLDLQKTELVVLSACETGLGEVKTGEGVYGLQRAFQIAGANAVLMSLWKVDDEATKNLMTDFYANWLQNYSKQKSFRMAQTLLRKKYPHPYYWAAFVMIGK
ncbi:MAG: CHAT domain-containing protein [Thermonemataceae bacterium]|nr:CHAT domain-containing protein [Thermonemataceae bacterium]